MTNKLLALLLCAIFALPLAAQNSKKVKDLQQQQSKLKTELQKSKSQLDQTRKQVKTGQQNVDFLGLQMNNRLSRIHQLEKELDDLEADIIRLQKNITELDSEVRTRRQRLKAAVRYARTQRSNNDPIVFVLSAKTISQMYRRARFAHEYASYQQNLGEQILQKQAELLDAQNLLLSAKSQKNGVLHEVMLQRKDLNVQQVQERQKVAGLKKKESGLQGKVAEQQKQIAALDKKIEQVIAYEIEQARKKAEEEAARKKAEEEVARKKAEEEEAEKKRLEEIKKNQEVPDYFKKYIEETNARSKAQAEAYEKRISEILESHKAQTDATNKVISDLQDKNKVLLDGYEQIKADAEKKAQQQKLEAHRNFITNKAKELGIPQWRIDEGFTIADDAEESSVVEYLNGVASHIKTSALPLDKGEILGGDKATKEDMDSVAKALVH